MVATGQRQGGRRLTLWVVAGLLLALIGFTAYCYFTRAYFLSDPDRLQKLANYEDLGGADSNEPVKPGEWPQWRGPERDGISKETGWLTTWPAGGPPRLWQKEAGAGYSSLVVNAGSIYTMGRDDDDEAVICWNAETGKEKWRHTYPGNYDKYKFDAAWGPGPRGTPAFDADFVYCVGATGIFHCLRADTGKVVWRKDLLKQFDAANLQWGVAFSPLVDGDLVFTSPGGTDGGALAAFDKKSGKLKWSALNDPAAYSSPVVSMAQGTRQIVFFTRNGLVSVAPGTGELLWRFPWETQYGANIATPVVVSNYVFISSGYGRGCAVVAVEKAPGGKLGAHRVYEHNQMRNHFASSVFYRGHIYGFDEGKLTCMDFRTGKIHWKESGFKKGSLVIADGWLIVLGEQGRLALAPASPDRFEAKSSFQISREKCWTAPVLAEGKLFIRDEKQIICFDLKKRK